MTKAPINYKNGKIYKIEPIIDHDESDIYIGSTTKQYLSQRMTAHAFAYDRYKNNKTTNTTSSFLLFDKYGIDNCYIILLELVEVNSKDELHQREAHYIKTLKCINKRIPLQPRKEYNQNNENKIKEYKKKSYERNKEKYKEKYKNNKEYKNDNEYKKEYYEAHKTEYILCEYCNKDINKLKKQQHYRTQIHIKNSNLCMDILQ